jgi:phospholipid transport system substrate-binding protein
MTMGWMKAASLAAIVMGAATAVRAEAADPAVQPVQSFYDTLLETMKQGKTLGIKGRYEKLKPVVEKSFDLPGMTRLSVGPKWNEMPPADQQALVAALSRYTIASYASNFNSFGGEKFVVEPASTERKADRVVMTKLVAGDQTIPFNYLMRLNGSNWKVIDIYLNGFVSQMAKQRSDFGATVAAGGAPALIKKIDSLADKLMKD